MPGQHCSTNAADEVKTGVYQWRNLVNGKVYVGSTSVSFRSRRKTHRGLLKIGKHQNRHLQGAWAKYGEESFAFEVLERCPPDDCVKREQHWMDTLKAVDQRYGYNLAPMAGSCRGRKLSPEHRAAILKANTGRPMHPSTEAAIRASRLGVKASEETKARLSASHKGNKHSAETRAKMSASHKKLPAHPNSLANLEAAQKHRVFSEETRRKMSEAAKRRKVREKQARNAASLPVQLEMPF